MAARADERVMLSERVAPGMLPRVLNSLDMTIIFVAIVLFIVIGLAGILWLIGDGHSATGGFGTFDNWVPHGGTWTLFGLVILALLGIEVPLNMGVEIVNMRSIKRYLFWGSIVVMVGYLWATFGTMTNLPASKKIGRASCRERV